MSKYTFQPEFEMLQTVYLNINNGEEVLVTNILFEVLTNLVKYQIMDQHGTKGWYYQTELTDTKILK